MASYLETKDLGVPLGTKISQAFTKDQGVPLGTKISQAFTKDQGVPLGTKISQAFTKDLRVPLGTRDLFGDQIEIRSRIIEIARSEFKKYGAIELDTPIIEHFSLITQLYGDEFKKLVYGLSDSKDDQRSKPTDPIDPTDPTDPIDPTDPNDPTDPIDPINNVFLRYDLTLPLARYIRMNNLKQIRRYQIGKVYRKDDPQISKGRFREFTQCDFDICSPISDTRINEFEILSAFDAILNTILPEKYVIKINDRRFVEELLTSFQIEHKDFQTVTTILDKLDKRSLDEIKQELLVKMINPMSIDKIFKTIQELAPMTNCSSQLIKYFENKQFATIGLINEIIQLNISTRIQFDPWIIRGLDYYTGLIFEASHITKTIISSSIGGGGAYNKLLPDNMEGVGMSIGVDRIATICARNPQPANNIYDIYVGTVGHSMVPYRFKLGQLLRSNGFSVCMANSELPSMHRQLETVFRLGIPFMVIIGPNEVANNQVQLKVVADKQQITINYDQIIDYLKKLINK
jgi:histidyl-tRNA synthetase